MFWPSIYMLAGSLAYMYWNDLQHLRDNTCRNLCDLKTSSKCVFFFVFFKQISSDGCLHILECQVCVFAFLSHSVFIFLSH